MNSGAPTHQRNPILGIARSILWTALFVLLVEVGIRMDDFLRYGTPIWSPYRTQSELIVRDIDGLHGRPFARFQKWVLNSHGMRGPEFTEIPENGVFRIATVGASETFGLYESPGKEYPRLLEDSLESARRSGRCACIGISRFEVINAAALGMTPPTVANDVRTRIARFKPHLVIYYPAPVQYLDDMLPRLARPDSSISRGQPVPFAWYFRPRLSNRLREGVKQSLPEFALHLARRLTIMRAQSSAPSQWDTLPTERLERFEEDLSVVLRAIRESGARPFVVTHANSFERQAVPDPEELTGWRRFYPRAGGTVLIQFDSAGASVTRAAAQREGAVLVDWFAAVRNLPANPFQDFVHMSDWGAETFAGLLTSSVIDAVASTALPR